jgi:putative hydrolase of the HAD superfamily
MEHQALTTLDSGTYMPFKAIFFDAAGTLFTTQRPVGEIYASLARQHGHEVSSAELSLRFRDCFSSSPPLAFPNAAPDAIAALEYSWWKKLVQRIFEPYAAFPRFDEYFAALFTHFSKPESWILYPETAETLQTLKSTGLTLAVITNFDSRVLNILEGLGVLSCFDSVLLSSRVGYAKPAREIFQKALSIYGLSPEDALHIGDSPAHDVAGARAAGLTAVLVDRRRKYTTDSYTRVDTLDQVLSLIQQRPSR